MPAKQLRSRGSLFLIASLLLGGCSGTVSELSYGVPSYGEGGSSHKGEIRSSEAIHRATMRPYEVFGRTYRPDVVEVGHLYKGVASWYGPDFHGNATSNGERYDMYGMTAAHKTLPMNTMVEVTNLESGKKVVARINDRGPFVKERIIDLSYAAGKELGLDLTGTASVSVKVLSFDKHVVLKQHPQTPYAVQIGSFSSKSGADRAVDEAWKRYEAQDFVIKKVSDGERAMFKVLIRGFKNDKAAREFIVQNGMKSAFIVAEQGLE